ncbi:uncharacterized protein EI90DRAFT_3011693 [Cantharellus anzutake]|uniref:uncharacterized protein n=1 Tax=Cantharellus anzutake TaxID=1750568 RepID=UPI001907B51C|nr:uncharacterized protein EI90DRAFT_3011693 [Cantharellus anzutake]KAF8342167.1 hypothetical protein EI90DRAFT_3011693 [Cantharellus anzutake]
MSMSGEVPTFDAFKCARHSVWRSAWRILPGLHLQALAAEDVELLVRIDIVAQYVERWEPPPNVLNIGQHWRMVHTAGQELCERGADGRGISMQVLQLLDEIEAGEEEDIINMWAYIARSASFGEQEGSLPL